MVAWTIWTHWTIWMLSRMLSRVWAVGVLAGGAYAEVPKVVGARRFVRRRPGPLGATRRRGQQSRPALPFVVLSGRSAAAIPRRLLVARSGMARDARDGFHGSLATCRSAGRASVSRWLTRPRVVAAGRRRTPSAEPGTRCRRRACRVRSGSGDVGWASAARVPGRVSLDVEAEPASRRAVIPLRSRRCGPARASRRTGEPACRPA
jgi:hypothetical protein